MAHNGDRGMIGADVADGQSDKTNGATLAAADAAGEARSVDVRRLAHELRTPLSAIAGLAEVMRDERLGPLGSERYRGYAAGIHDSAGHAMSVLASYIDTGRSSGGGGMPTAFVEVDVGALVQECVTALTPLAEGAGVVLEQDVGPRLPHLIADRRSLRQILDNLVANALKFTPPRGRISVSVGYAAGGPVAIEVSDTGDGMTPGELERARSGASAPEPHRRRSGGTGYGLPLVHVLAAACGASLEIDSILRRGTRVIVSFPHDRVVPV